MTVILQKRRMLVLGVACALALAAAAAGLFFNASYASRSADAAEGDDLGILCFGHVDVEGGVVAIYPGQAGRVVQIEAKENEAVAAGGVLLRLDDGPATLRAQEAEAALRVVQAQLEEARQLPDRHQAKVSQQRSALQAAQFRLSAARHMLERKRDLHKLDQLNAQEVATAADLVRELEAVEQAEKDRLRELELTDSYSTVRRLEGELAVAQARLAQARRAVEDCVLRAPEDGKVLRLQAGVGDLVGPAPASAAVLFCSDRPRIIRAEVSQEFAAHVKPGAKCTVVDDYDTSEMSWRGKIVRVSDWYSQRRSVWPDPSQRHDVRTLECIVQIEPGHPPLRIGQRMRLTIVR